MITIRGRSPPWIGANDSWLWWFTIASNPSVPRAAGATLVKTPQLRVADAPRSIVVCPPHRGCDVLSGRVEPFDAALDAGGVGVDDLNERLCFLHGQAAGEQHRPVMVVAERQMPVPHRQPVLALQPDGFAILHRLRCQHLHQMARQATKLRRVMGSSEPDHQLLRLVNRVGRGVAGQVVQHSGDRLGLTGQHRPVGGGCTDEREPGQTLPGSDQPAGFATGQVRHIRQPRRRRRAMLLPRELGGINTGRVPRLPRLQPGARISDSFNNANCSVPSTTRSAPRTTHQGHHRSRPAHHCPSAHRFPAPYPNAQHRH